MRIVMRFIGVLAAVLLIAVPVMGVSAQGGASVPSPVIPEVGTGGEIQTMVEGLLYKGSGYVPGVTASEPPGILPVTGGGWELQTMIEGLLYKGSGSVTAAAPEALPPTGTALTGLTEFESQLRLNEMIAGGISANFGHPAALPATGSLTGSGPAFQVPAPWFSTATAIWSDDVIHALSGVSIGASAQPRALPRAGTAQAKPPF